LLTNSLDLTLEHLNNFHKDGFLILDRLIDQATVPMLHQAFDDLFTGYFETGVQPDEVNWQASTGDPTLTRQICNGWKANRSIAKVVLSSSLGQAIAQLAGWNGVRIMIDNVIWKPPGTRPLGYHQDNAYLSWFTPSDLLTCWIALDDTHRDGGTLEFAQGSHHWPYTNPTKEFHGPEKYKLAMQQAAVNSDTKPEIQFVEVPAGGGSFHHGWIWHGSGPNTTQSPIGPIYSRYKRLGDNTLDENFFPIIWQNDGYRTPEISLFLND